MKKTETKITEAETPKAEEPKVETPKAEEPKAEEPKVETPKAEEPEVETPKAEEPKDKLQTKLEKAFAAYPDAEKLYSVVGKHVFLTYEDAKTYAGKEKITTHTRK